VYDRFVPEVPTDVRATVRVLLRGLPHSDVAQRSIEGYVVLVTGKANVNGWPNQTLRDDDLEGIVWTTPRQVQRLIQNLRANSCVIDAIGVEAVADDL
jgi:hypothetical protein